VFELREGKKGKMFRYISKHRGSQKHQLSLLKLPRKKKEKKNLLCMEIGQVRFQREGFFSWGAGLLAHTQPSCLSVPSCVQFGN